MVGNLKSKIEGAVQELGAPAKKAWSKVKGAGTEAKRAYWGCPNHCCGETCTKNCSGERWRSALDCCGEMC